MTTESKETVWPLWVHSPWFEHLQTGRKIYEGRVNKGNATQMVPGHFLEVGLAVNNKRVLSQKPFRLQIVNVRRFNSFHDALTQLAMESILPGVKTLEEGLSVYRKFVSEETEQTHGVLMIEVAQLESRLKNE